MSGFELHFPPYGFRFGRFTSLQNPSTFSVFSALIAHHGNLAITIYNTLHRLLSSSMHILRAYSVLVNTRLHILFIWYTWVRVRM